MTLLLEKRKCTIKFVLNFSDPVVMAKLHLCGLRCRFQVRADYPVALESPVSSWALVSVAEWRAHRIIRCQRFCICRLPNMLQEEANGIVRVTYLGKVPTTGMQFLSGCTEKPVIELWKKHTLAREDIFPANALLEIRPFQVWLHHLDHKGEATVHMDTFQVARIAYCTADHNVSPNIFAWVYREINDDLSYQMDCHAVECESKLEAKKLAHAMMEAFKKTFHSMKSDGRIHRDSSSEEVSQEMESDDG
ncbi:PTB-containing, cubilin and LRP1-interacting protein [Pteropus alecto]|uniref:PTB-containing, cubilin and LRP1-interacting protein n=1 Tax=Pteropus alecto TaxID=9402 RepID=UPI00076883E7|nr:PTB-containing, cubilin and LRP1-interacting protein [Pteropus alecto]